MKDLLFEIGVEELPALSIEQAIDFMKNFLEKALLEERLDFSSIETYGTPRRLVVFIKDLKQKQEDFSEEILGPRAEFTQAIEGFCKSKNILPQNLYKKSTPKGEILAAKIDVKGKLTKDILPGLLYKMMVEIPFKKRMRWELSGDTFLRPVRWLVLLFNGEHLSLKFADVITDKYSRGHRLMDKEKFEVLSIEQYKNELENRFVMLDSKKRKSIFIKEANLSLAKLNAKIRHDDELLNIVINLVEYPFVVLGEFENKYLEIPKEILISEMKTHQKCFAVENELGALLPYFIASSAIEPYNKTVFALGNARVIRARFADGAYYFHEDQKKSLLEHAKRLPSLMFEQKLGSMADKSQRIEELALKLAKNLNLDLRENIKIAAPLLKADLVCGVVAEFPELEGVMGAIYAKNNGFSSEVCEAIKTHYYPKSAEGDLPQSKLSAVLSIADKLDTLVGIIGIGKMPTGNKDPYALRRAAIGIIRIILKFNFKLELYNLISHEAGDFLLQRARGIFLEKYPDARLVDAVLKVNNGDIVDMDLRISALFSLKEKDSENFERLLSTFKRASNIIKKTSVNFITIEEKMFSDIHEKNLYNALINTKNSIINLDYNSMLLKINELRPKLDDFFDNVMVMVEDEKLKIARLSLLNEIRSMAIKIADFDGV